MRTKGCTTPVSFQRSFSLITGAPGVTSKVEGFFTVSSTSAAVSEEDAWPKQGIAQADETRRITKALTAVWCDLEMKCVMNFPFAESAPGFHKQIMGHQGSNLLRRSWTGLLSTRRPVEKPACRMQSCPTLFIAQRFGGTQAGSANGGQHSEYDSDQAGHGERHDDRGLRDRDTQSGLEEPHTVWNRRAERNAC